MKGLKKLSPQTPDRESVGSSFLSAIGARRSFREGRGGRSTSALNENAHPYDLSPQGSFHLIGDQSTTIKSKGVLDFCQDGDADQLRKLILTRPIQSKVLQTLNSSVDVYGNTNLHVTVSHKDFTLSAILLVKGADPNKFNKSGVSPTVLSLRLLGLSHKLTQLLIGQGGKLPPEELEKESKGLYVSNSNLASQKIASSSPLIPKKLQTPLLVPVAKGKSTMLLSPLYQKPENSHPISSASVDTLNAIGSFDLGKVNKAIPSLPLSPHTAAYLNIKPSDKLSCSQFISLKNKHGVTPLMKAAYKGHLSMIEEYILPGASKTQINGIDSRGLTALCYACLSGHLSTVAFLVEVGKAQIEGGDAPGIQPWVEVFTPTPLILASFNGHADVVRYLVSKGADVNARVGSPKGCTAIMIACWMRRMDVVRILVNGGATARSEGDDWVKQGLRKMKRLSTEFPMSEWDLQGWLVKFKSPVSDPAKKTASKKDQLFLLSSDDMDDASRLIQILKTEKSSLLPVQPMDMESRVSVNDQKLHSNSQNESGVQEGRLDLTEHLPLRGTDLDEAFLQVFKCITQLAVAANKHDKATYVFDQVHENRHSAEVESSHNILDSEDAKGWPRPNVLTYEKYKQLNDLLNVEQLSKTMQGSNNNLESIKVKDDVQLDPDSEYFKALEIFLKKFVVSVTELKKIQQQKQKDRYIQASNLVCTRANEIIEEIQGFDLFVDFADSFDSVVLDEDDIEAIEKTGVKLNILDFPAPALFLLDISQQEVLETSARVEELGREASLAWSTPETEKKMLEACIPCVMAVKKLFSVAKAVAGKIRICWEGDLRRQQEWNRTTTQNGNVMALFEAWRGTSSESSEQYDIAKLKLDDKIDGIVFDSKQNTLKGGQLSKLVELITSHNSYDSEMAAILLMCHHSFATSVELLKTLTCRYESIVPPSNLNEREFTAWFEIKVKPIQQKQVDVFCTNDNLKQNSVLKVLVSWISLYFEEDFMQNEILLSNARDFIEKVVLIDWEVNGKLLLGTMDLKMVTIGTCNQTHQPKQGLKLVPKTFGLFSGIDPAVLFSDATRILELDPLEFAKQLTISEFEDFLLVRASECLDQIWASKIEKERAAARLQALGRKTAGKTCASKEYVSSPQSAISRMISHTNNLTIWIATVLISTSNIKIRVILLKYFAQCAIKCRELKNYNGITGIVAGLSMAPVARLHHTWRKFNKHYPSICAEYEQTAEIVSPKGQYSSYRKEMKDIKLPAIPFLGLFFTDLTFIDLGNPELLPNTNANPSRNSRIINFDKCKKVHGVIKEIQKFQATPFPWQPIEGIQDFLGRIGETKARFSSENALVEEISLSGLGIATEEELYTQSLVIEPKEEEQDDDSDEEQ
ncbi:UNVERIFIED_CONTAM: hypothetical protein HDU68_006657 [Siphonaria sp. JEL0065]|nr:hypothetical protein HDU68_006657 [Siphonaria sp. JEL0065]